MGIPHGAETTGKRVRDRNLLRFIRDSHFLNCSSTSRQRLLDSSRAAHQEHSSGSREGREGFIPSLESGFSEPVKREDWEMLERLARGLKVPEGLSV